MEISALAAILKDVIRNGTGKMIYIETLEETYIFCLIKNVSLIHTLVYCNKLYYI